MLSPFEFKIDKALEAILFIVEKTNSPTFHQVSKIMYFADRAHLENYGRFISGDSYVAMKHGPVPSQTYNLLKSGKGLNTPIPNDVASMIHRALEIFGDYHVKGRREANLDKLSDSDIECLRQAVEQYGHLDFNTLTELSHDDTWNSSGENDFIELEDFIKTFDDSQSVLDHLSDPHPGLA